MTVATNDSRVEATGDDVGPVVGDFNIFEIGSIKVNSVVIATGVKTLLTEGVEFTTTLDSATLPSEFTCAVITPLTNFPPTVEWIVTRDEPDTQTFNPTAFTSVDAAAIETQLDRLTLKLQEVEEILTRCIKAPIGDPMQGSPNISMTLPNSVDRASETLTFDADGTVTTTA